MASSKAQKRRFQPVGVKCKIAYQVESAGGHVTIFRGKKFARAFQKEHPGSQIRAVELCERRGPIRRGKRSFAGR